MFSFCLLPFKSHDKPVLIISFFSDTNLSQTTSMHVVTRPPQGSPTARTTGSRRGIGAGTGPELESFPFDFTPSMRREKNGWLNLSSRKARLLFYLLGKHSECKFVALHHNLLPSGASCSKWQPLRT